MRLKREIFDMSMESCISIFEEKKGSSIIFTKRYDSIEFDFNLDKSKSFLRDRLAIVQLFFDLNNFNLNEEEEDVFVFIKDWKYLKHIKVKNVKLTVKKGAFRVTMPASLTFDLTGNSVWVDPREIILQTK